MTKIKTAAPATRIFVCTALACAFVSFAQAPAATDSKTVETLVLPALDSAKLARESAANWEIGQPAKFAQPRTVGIAVSNLAGDKRWQATKDGMLVWRQQISSPGAKSLNFHFNRFFMPHGGTMTLISPDGSSRGPFTDAHNRPGRALWTPLLVGDTAEIEIRLPADMLPFLEVSMNSVNHGFVEPLRAGSIAKSGSCNLDVVCPEGDPWRDEIRSVGAYTVGGVEFCTGTLINNVEGDGTPYFLTADHCEVRTENADSVVIYWNYESPECRAPGSAESGNPLSLNLFDETSSGTEFVATNAASDFTLLRLSEIPPLSYNLYYSGWDRSGDVPASAVGIHHPRVDEKRISFENEALTITGRGETTGGGDGYLRVADWDLGTTEGGSSGSGLWDPQKRLVGQLFGGFAACGNDEPDWYGRLSVSWDRGTTPDTRLSDWLDPNDTGQSFVDGKDSCERPVVNVSSNNNPAQAGQSIVLSASASGGTGPYTFTWDLNGDGSTDMAGQQAETHYPGAFNDQVTVRATDATGCVGTASMAQSVSAPVIELTNVGTAMEMCGDGDGIPEPGERISMELTFQNTGNMTAADARATFVASAQANTQYTLVDDSASSCRLESLDISGSGQSLVFDPSGTFDANDDGGAVINLQGAGLPLYDQTATEITLATNGYLSLSTNDLGADFSSNCPLPASPDLGNTVAARIMPFHDDLVVENAYYEYFASCPRSDDGGSNGPCQVFQWDNASLYSNTGPAQGNFDVQTIVYSNSGNMAFQYLGDDLPSSTSTTVGLQNAGATQASTFACGLAADSEVELNQAVCAFAPAALSRSDIDLETPSLSLGNLAANASTTVTLVFSLRENMTCGAEFGFDYLGSVFDGGFSDAKSSAFYVGRAGGDQGQCNSSASCPAAAGNTVAPKTGLMYNPARPGNGSETQFLGQSVSMLWYTATESHYPRWYQIGGGYQNNQLVAPIKFFKLNGLPFETNVNPSRVEVGEAVVHWLTPTDAIFVWTLDGKTWGERIEFFVTDTDPVDEAVTGQWYNAGELGWGIAYNKQGDTDVQTVYLYDDDGNPVWLLNPAQYVNGLGQLKGYQWVHCPTCPWSQAQPQDAGTMIGTLDASASGAVDVDIDLPAPMNGTWVRSDLDIIKIQ